MTSSWPHRAAVTLAACTFVLIIAGGLVTSTGSGLAVPDWPLSFGQLFPRMEGGVLYEHGHRMIATFVGLVTIVCAIIVQRQDPRAWVRRLGWIALLAVVVQGVLGGITVLMRLPTAVSVSHAGLAQGFFSLTVVLATVTSPRWLEVRPAAPTSGAPHTRSLAVAVVVAIYLQILLGAVVRHTGAGLAIPDFPLNNGRLVPEFTSHLVVWQYLHRLGAVVATALVAWISFRVIRLHRGKPWLTRPAALLLGLVVVQVLLGGITVWVRKAVTPTTAHVAAGALLLVTAVALALRAYRSLGAAEPAAEQDSRVAA